MQDKIKITQIIPDFRKAENYIEFAGHHSLGFEYNDFYDPDLLDDKNALEKRISLYNGLDRTNKNDTLHGAFYDIVPFSFDKGIRKHSVYRMQQSVEIAGRLGCKAVIFHTNLMPGLVGGEKYRNNWLETMADTVRQLLSQDSQIHIYCENMFDDSPYELADLAKILSDEPRFGVCLDIGHMMLVTNEPDKWFDVLSPYIRHFHINDNHFNRDEHLELGGGSIDWRWVFTTIQKYALTNRSMLLEVNGTDKISKSFRYLEQNF